MAEPSVHDDGIHCGYCREWNVAGTEVCTYCERPFAPIADPVGLPPPRTLSIPTFMAAIAVVAVGLGLARAEPILGIGWAIMALAALVRTRKIVAKRLVELRPMRALAKIGTYLYSISSLGAVVIVSLVFGILPCGLAGALFGTAIAPLFTEVKDQYDSMGYAFYCALAAGISGSLGLFVFLISKCWRIDPGSGLSGADWKQVRNAERL